MKGLVALVMAAALLIPTASTTALAATPGSDFTAIDRYLADQVSEARIPGLALGVVHRDQVVHLQGFGHADAHGTAVTPQTPFFVGSLSKSFTALAVMQLHEAGKVDLDRPVRTYLPAFRLADETASSRITVRELLNQTSGIPTSAGIAPLSQAVTSLDDQVRALASIAPASKPGERYAYSNANYQVLGRLVEELSGQPFNDYVAAHIFVPLAMHHTYTDVTNARAAGLSSAATLWFGLPQWHPQGAGYRADTVPAGYLMSTAEDMSHYLVAELNGGRYGDQSILSPAGMSELHQGVAPAGVSAQGGSYAMGWFAGPRGRVQQTIWHNGSAASMHAMVEMTPGDGWGVVVLTNTESLLYEFLARIDVIADNVMARLEGQPLGGTLAGLYLVFDAAAIIFVAIAIRNLARVLRRRPRARAPRFGRAGVVFFDWVVPMWREVWVPLAILLGLPLVLGAPWIGNLLTTDVGQWLFLLGTLLLLTGATRLALRLSRRPRRLPRPRARLSAAGALDFAGEPTSPLSGL